MKFLEDTTFETEWLLMDQLEKYLHQSKILDFFAASNPKSWTKAPSVPAG